MLSEGIVLRRCLRTGEYALSAGRDFVPGELVWQEGGFNDGRPRTSSEIRALPPRPRAIYRHWMFQIGHDLFESLPEFDILPMRRWHSVRPDDLSMYMNHSCDPTCWFVVSHDGRWDTMTTIREVRVGEELTYDYATTECIFTQPWHCLCGTDRCRGRATCHDWARLDLQRRYIGHFAPHVQQLIDAKVSDIVNRSLDGPRTLTRLSGRRGGEAG